MVQSSAGGKGDDHLLLFGFGAFGVTAGTYYVIAVTYIYFLSGKFSSPNPKFGKLSLIDLPSVGPADEAGQEKQSDDDARRTLVRKLVSKRSYAHDA